MCTGWAETGRGVNEGVAISFCSKEEKPHLEEIQGFLNKKIEVLKIGKESYAHTVACATESNSPVALIREHEAWLREKEKKIEEAVKANRIGGGQTHT